MPQMHPSILRAQLEQYNIFSDTQWSFTAFRYPVFGVLLYYASVRLFQPTKSAVAEAKLKRQQEKQQQQLIKQNNHQQQPSQKKLTLLEKLMFFHNVILSIFSILCFINTFPILYNIFSTFGYESAVCDNHLNIIYDTPNYGLWNWLFYMSKFYEFIDTWIVMARGRRPITLQVYHHCGAVFGMWLNTVMRTSVGYLFVCENSFIHTIMYFYYAMSVLGINMKAKFVITILQIIQFITGLGVTLYQIVNYHNCMRYEDLFAAWFQWVYVFVLLIMFVQFYQKSYLTKSKKKVGKIN